MNTFNRNGRYVGMFFDTETIEKLYEEFIKRYDTEELHKIGINDLIINDYHYYISHLIKDGLYSSKYIVSVYFQNKVVGYYIFNLDYLNNNNSEDIYRKMILNYRLNKRYRCFPYNSNNKEIHTNWKYTGKNANFRKKLISQ